MYANSDLLEYDGQYDATSIPMECRICEVETIDGSDVSEQAPQYQVETAKMDPVANDYRVKLTGLGEQSMDSGLRKSSTSYAYPAPEVLFDSQLSPSADICSLGCTV